MKIKKNWTQITQKNILIMVILLSCCLISYSTSSSLQCLQYKQPAINEMLTSQSYMIAQGTLIIDTVGINESVKNQNYKSFKLSLIPNSIIKGNSTTDKVIEINYSTRPVQLRPCISSILKLD